MNMRILDKYIAKYFILPFLYCLTVFIVLYIIIDLFGRLDEVLKQSINMGILWEYYLSMIPLIVTQTAPVASLISTIYVLGTLNKYGRHKHIQVTNALYLYRPGHNNTDIRDI